MFASGLMRWFSILTLGQDIIATLLDYIRNLDLVLAEYFWTPSSCNLLQDSPGDLPKLAQSPTALKNTGSFLLHPTTLHLNMLFISESQNITLLLVIFFCHTRVFLFVCFLKLSFFSFHFFLNLALTDTEPIILNYSKNTFIATSSLSYMTQLRKSTLINPSMVTTLKQKKKSLHCSGLLYVLLS